MTDTTHLLAGDGTDQELADAREARERYRAALAFDRTLDRNDPNVRARLIAEIKATKSNAGRYLGSVLAAHDRQATRIAELEQQLANAQDEAADWQAQVQMERNKATAWAEEAANAGTIGQVLTAVQRMALTLADLLDRLSAPERGSVGGGTNDGGTGGSVDAGVVNGATEDDGRPASRNCGVCGDPVRRDEGQTYTSSTRTFAHLDCTPGVGLILPTKGDVGPYQCPRACHVRTDLPYGDDGVWTCPGCGHTHHRASSGEAN